MRNEDQGISGDAQRLEQLGWMLFLKIIDDKDQDPAPTALAIMALITLTADYFAEQRGKKYLQGLEEFCKEK